MELKESTLAILHRLHKLSSYINRGKLCGHKVYAIVDYNDEERLCTIPPNGGKPMLLDRSSKTPYPIAAITLPCYIPRLNTPGIDPIHELSWLNTVIGNRMSLKFKALVDLRKDTVTPIGENV